MMTKKVNIRTTRPIKTIKPPVEGIYNGVDVSTGDIKLLILGGAIVHEVLEDGSTLLLNFGNYHTVNKPMPKPIVNEVSEDKELPVDDGGEPITNQVIDGEPVDGESSEDEEEVVDEDPLTEPSEDEEEVVDEDPLTESSEDEKEPVVEPTTPQQNNNKKNKNGKRK